MSYEVLARLFYTPNRHVVDLLGIPPAKTALIDDVVGLTRSLPLYMKEAEVPYFFHGRNGMEDALRPASSQPVYYWKSPDGDRHNMPLVTTRNYHAIPAYGFLRHDPIPKRGIDVDEKKIAEQIHLAQKDDDCERDCILYHYSWDFNPPFFQCAEKAKAWNQKWSYPKLISSTMSTFFDDISSQVDPDETCVFEKDAPNTWIDQDYTDAQLAGRARKLGYALPTIEKFSTVCMALGGKDYPWKEIWESYNLLLMYHEHTNCGGETEHAYLPPSLKNKQKTAVCYYETEKVMHENLILEGERLAREAERATRAKLVEMVATSCDTTIVVFNPLNWMRSDIVTVTPPRGLAFSNVVDNATGRSMPCQKLADGNVVFLAEMVPSVGYKTFSVIRQEAEPEAAGGGVTVTESSLENRFYKIAFDRLTGGIANIYDKQLDVELVDQESRYKLNEYLYHLAPDGEVGSWHYPVSATFSPEVGPVAASMVATVQAQGARQINQTVRIYADIKRIDFIQDIDKASCGRQFNEYVTQKKKEAVFYALPLNVPDFQIRHELAGTVVQPIVDQAIGSNTDYYAIQHFADISGSRFGVTLATIEPGLVEYGRPIPSTVTTGRSELTKPTNSHLFLYLMNNWFFTNICFDQPGPKTFTWSIRSHEGDWRRGKAYQFGWDVSHPLTATVVQGKRDGLLPPTKHSFVEVRSDQSNVVLTTVKPAEANGSGFILRFNELIGTETKVTVKPHFMETIAHANETSLIEVDRSASFDISRNNEFTFTIRPHGVKTIRLRAMPEAVAVQNVTARAISDMRVDLTWDSTQGDHDIDHYNIYRYTSSDFEPGLRYLVGQTAKSSFSDRPKLNYGGWMDNRLIPETTYYYRVCSVDLGNNRGQSSASASATTLPASRKNEIPQKVKGLYTAHVSPNDPFNAVSLWFYTNVEPDITAYRVYRGNQPQFEANDASLLVEIDAMETVTHTLPHGFDTVVRKARDYNRQLYVDEDVVAGETYYYRVSAVDSHGQHGPLSDESSVTIETPPN